MATSIALKSATVNNTPQKLGSSVGRGIMYTGKALEFDGVSDSLVSSCAAITLGDPFTFSAWINVDNVSGTKLIATNGVTTNSRYFIVEGNDLALLNYKGSYASDVKIKTSTITLTAGVWHFVVATFDGETTGALYIDGALESLLAVCATPSASTSGTTNIGRNGRTDAYEYPYAGKMCNLQIWDKKWETSDVQYAYNNPETLITGNSSITAGITTSNLLLWLPMNDTGITNPQTVVFDASGTNITNKAHGVTTFSGDNFATSDGTAVGSGDYEWAATATFANTSSTCDTTSNSGEMTIKFSGSPVDGNNAYAFWKFADVVAGRTYTFSFDYITTSGNLKIRVGPTSSYVSELAATVVSTGAGTGSVTLGANTFVASATGDTYIVLHTADSGSKADVRIDNFVVKEIGIATGWTDSDQQDTIPQSALMDGSVKLVGPTNIAANASPHYTLDSTGTTDSGTAYSVSTWLMRTTTPGATDNYLLGHSGNDRIYFPSSSQVGWTTDGTGTTISLSSSDYYPQLNQWEFWTFVSDSGTYRIYRNGVEAATSSQSPSNGLDYSHIGVYSAIEATTCFEGTIDELAIWNTVLSPTEVTELYNNGAPLDAQTHSEASTLQAYWRNNNLNTSGKMKDLIGSNHATITEAGDDFHAIYFPEGITSGKDSQGFISNIRQSHRGSAWIDGVASYIDLGVNPSLTNLFEAGGTIMIWVKLLSPTSNLYFAHKGGNGNYGWQFGTDTYSGGTAHVQFIAQHVTTDGKAQKQNSLSINTWTHYAVTYDSTIGNEPVLYKDGALVTSLDVDQTSVGDYRDDEDYHLEIGRKNTSDQGNWNGLLDNFKAYDRVLSATEIKENYDYSKGQHTD